MPSSEKHSLGTFCWVELATTDQRAAKTFYATLFGWSVKDLPMGPDDFYSMFQLEGRDVAAVCTLHAKMRAEGVPPHWNLYIAVECADQAVQRATQLGGKVTAPAFDVFDAGRMAALQDPTGANFCVWQPKAHTGTGVSGIDGTLCWADLSTPDPARAAEFYTGLFGWTMTKGEADPSGYLHIKSGEEFIGGIPPAAQLPTHTPAHWLLYFQVSDCDAAAARATQLGAKFHAAPMTMEKVGRFAVVADPQGAVFTIFQSARRDQGVPAANRV
jgi:hypothetical protein